jgi:glucose-6-phosphate 1-dehydrogenase
MRSTTDAFVFFGASGNLAYKQIFPALFDLTRRGELDMPVIGVASAPWSVEQLRARAHDSLAAYGQFDEAMFAKLAKRLRYIPGDYRAPATFEQLHRVLDGAERPLYYLAIPPSLFPTVIDGVAGGRGAGLGRVVVEKPFGRDLASAQALHETLRKHFAEASVFPDRPLHGQGACSGSHLLSLRELVFGADLEPRLHCEHPGHDGGNTRRVRPRPVV